MWAKFSGLFIALSIVILLLLLSNRATSARFEPTPYVQPTSTFLPQPVALLPNRWINVVASADHANPFDSFNVNEVVVRVSNSNGVDDGADGRFLIPPCTAGQSISVWAPGYEIKSVPCDGEIPDPIELIHLDAIDNTTYLWSAAASDCNTCHGNQYMPNSDTCATY